MALSSSRSAMAPPAGDSVAKPGPSGSQPEAAEGEGETTPRVVNASTQESPPEPLWIDSEACLEPDDAWRDGTFPSLVHDAVGLSQSKGVLAAIVTRPYFYPEVLSLHRRKGGAYFLKLTRLHEDVEKKVMQRMSELGGGSLDKPRQARLLADMDVPTDVHERPLDAETAALFQQLSAALVTRAQRISVPLAEFKFDGTSYGFWHAGTLGIVVSPRFRSVLGRALFAAEWLTELVEKKSADDKESLHFIRLEMRVALHRTQRQEPCVKPYVSD